MRAYTTDISPDVLDAGRWVAGRHGILHWQPDPAAIVEAPPKPPADEIVCPTCNATAADWCRYTSGKVRGPHPERWADRTCACGNPPYAKRSRYCRECWAKARRESWQARDARKRGKPLDIYAQRREDAADEFRQYARGEAS